MKLVKWVGICLLLLTGSLTANDKEYIVLHCREGSGMFSIFSDVLSLVKQSKKERYNGVEVDFVKEGQYYSEEHGNNWWTYYCEPIQFGEKINVRHILGDCPGAPSWDIERHTTRHEARRLIGDYIHFKPEIMEKIAQFQIDNFVGKFVISVHYRGTDKISEAPPVDYETVFEKVNEIIRTHTGSKYKIFVATDEQAFLDFMISHYGNMVCYNPDAIRSCNGEPLHMGNFDRYQCGLDAIMDAILLSRGHYLIRMSSNLSLWSTFFNPDIPVYELNKRY